MAFRDPAGLRPLALGQLGDRYCVASESCAFDIIGAKLLREVEPGELVSIGERGIEVRQVVSGARRAFCVFEHIYFARPDTQARGHGSRRCRARKMGEILRREAPVQADLVIAVPDSGNAAAQRLLAGVGHPEGRRPDQEPLRGPHVHPAGPGAAQARPAAEVQPAAGDRRRQAHRGGGRLDRARQHHAPDRADAARRRRRRGAPAHFRPADPASRATTGSTCPPRGDDRPRADRRGGRARSWAATRSRTCRSTGVYEAIGLGRETHCDACFTGEYPLEGTESANGKFALEDSAVVLPQV